MDLYELYDEMFEYMELEVPYFTRHFLKMGRPEEMMDSPYAYVKWDPDDNELHFCLNVENVSKLDDDGRLFVGMHETFHVLLEHNKVNLPDHQKRNIAEDIIINDYLVDRGIKKLDGVVYGEDVIGQDSLGMTVREVYELLPESPQMMQMPGQGDGDGENGDGTGDGSCGLPEPGDDEGDGCGGQHGPHGIPQDILDKIKADAKEFSDLTDPDQGGGKLAGTGHDKEQKWLDQEAVKFQWLEMLRHLVPDLMKNGPIGTKAYSWNKLNRKVAWQAPRVLLPVYRPTTKEGKDEGGKLPAIVLAIDTSGSISQQTRDKFMRLAKSIPQDKIDVYACSFTDSYLPLDINNPNFRSGGTSFSAVEEFIREHVLEQFGNYPKVVCIFTDGEASFNRVRPTKAQLGGWHWFIQGDGGYGGYWGLPADDKNSSGSWQDIDKYVGPSN